MKSRRFKDYSIFPKGYRKLDVTLKMAFDFVWMNCDESGVWDIDEDFFAFENGFELDLDQFLNAFNGLVEVFEEKLLLKDFIRVQNPTLKKDYNPHKPIFRAIEHNNLKLEPSLNQAYFKLVNVNININVSENVNKEETREEKIEVYPTFEDFWNEYDKKVGKRDKIEVKWNKLSQATKEQIMAYIPDYKRSQPDKQYRKNPETFLNNESWKDELIFETINTEPSSQRKKRKASEILKEKHGISNN